MSNSNPLPLIELVEIGKVYYAGKVPVVALHDVNLRIQRGEFVVIMGPSGSGKTTLLNVLGALDRPSAGQYLLEGVDVTKVNDKELSRVRNQHFGFVFQSYNLFPELTAEENVMVPMIYAGVAGKIRRSRARELLAQFGLADRIHHLPTQMSGGEQQRVAIARALANDPSLILADEPTGNLPSAQGEEIMKLLCQLNDQGMTVVVVTHDARIGGYGKRLLQLKDGTIIQDGPVAQRFQPVSVAV
ncbi:MAG: ABC transporter ATP-binding protein [Firmicutes bacterium]|nr:ABC transporter ATP-binding protein [Bacillota bacterium]